MLICSLICLFSYWFSFLPCLIFSILSRVLLGITSQIDYLYPSRRLRPCVHKLLSMMWWFCVLFEKQVSAGIKVKELYPHSLQMKRSLEISHPFLSINIWWSLTKAKSFSMGCRVCPDEQNIVLVSKTLDLRMRHERWKKKRNPITEEDSGHIKVMRSSKRGTTSSWLVFHHYSDTATLQVF